MIRKLRIHGLCFLLMLLSWQEVTANGSSDSLYVEKLLRQASVLPADSNRILFFARQLEGNPYRAGTLETGSKEELVVRMDGFDCFTFMETVLALAQCSYLGQSDYADFCFHLQALRYRNGLIYSYASRLHYFSDWVEEHTQKGRVCERTAKLSQSIRHLSLNFMTTHASLYPALGNPSVLDSMQIVESRWENYSMPYVEKAKLNDPAEELAIHNGDILALVTLKEGLDVVHVGFAYWVDGKLHLVHASSLCGKVLFDPVTLFHYLEKKPSHIGVRVIAPVF